MKKCLIVSGGIFEKIKLQEKYNLVLACDKGYLYANKLKIKPDIIIGDFDSSKMPQDNANIIAVDSVKDDTDTGLAVKYALRNGYKYVYNEWKKKNPKSNTATAAYNAGYILTMKYEVPADTTNQAKKRGNTAKNMYSIMTS